jgi:hypothetical protein
MPCPPQSGGITTQAQYRHSCYALCAGLYVAVVLCVSLFLRGIVVFIHAGGLLRAFMACAGLSWLTLALGLSGALIVHRLEPSAGRMCKSTDRIVLPRTAGVVLLLSSCSTFMGLAFAALCACFVSVGPTSSLDGALAFRMVAGAMAAFLLAVAAADVLWSLVGGYSELPERLPECGAGGRRPYERAATQV